MKIITSCLLDSSRRKQSPGLNKQQQRRVTKYWIRNQQVVTIEISFRLQNSFSISVAESCRGEILPFMFPSCRPKTTHQKHKAQGMSGKIFPLFKVFLSTVLRRSLCKTENILPDACNMLIHLPSKTSFFLTPYRISKLFPYHISMFVYLCETDCSTKSSWRPYLLHPCNNNKYLLLRYKKES